MQQWHSVKEGAALIHALSQTSFMQSASLPLMCSPDLEMKKIKTFFSQQTLQQNDSSFRVVWQTYLCACKNIPCRFRGPAKAVIWNESVSTDRIRIKPKIEYGFPYSIHFFWRNDSLRNYSALLSHKMKWVLQLCSDHWEPELHPMPLRRREK